MQHASILYLTQGLQLCGMRLQGLLLWPGQPVAYSSQHLLRQCKLLPKSCAELAQLAVTARLQAGRSEAASRPGTLQRTHLQVPLPCIKRLQPLGASQQ